ncbi:MAG: hypothetical protein DYG88_05845 [Chloroflexi bacterium CFX4]|nr:hypothetical protein [Chloroflexi bacterium CFX4]MDL1922866.1 hypothetical protein [Chloroflexi bacterium CFX3]
MLNDPIGWAEALEAERKQLAALLERRLTPALNLLLAQSSAYEQAFAAMPQTRTAFAVLSSLARQTMQHLRDLSADLQPTLLETLGIEAAFESLLGQVQRNTAITISYAARRLTLRLALPLEFALYRTLQKLLEDAVQRHVPQLALSLIQVDNFAVLTLQESGGTPPDLDQWRQLGAPLAIFGVQSSAMREAASAALTFTCPSAEAVMLTPRENEVLRLLAEGLSNKQIGAALGLSIRTVKFHLDNLYSKLGVHSRAEALITAVRRGWLR